jgi:hypothetical protein
MPKPWQPLNGLIAAERALVSDRIDVHSPEWGIRAHKEFLSRNPIDYFACREPPSGTKSIKPHFLQKLYGTALRGRTMHPSDEFQKRAADCMQMARQSRDPESKAMWNRMAARWRRCAETYEVQSLAARDQSPKHHRQSPPGWARH